MFVLIIPSSILAKSPEGSKIANILVEGKSESEMANELADRVSTWMNGNDFILISDYERITLPRDIFEFDIQGTIDQFQQETKQSFFSFFKPPQSVQIPLQVSVKQTHDDIEHFQSLEYINHEKSIQQLLNTAENLAEKSFNLAYTDEENLPFEEVANY